MLNDPIVLVVVDALNAEKIPFLVAGSLSSNVISLQMETLYCDYVHRWCDSHDTRETLAEVLHDLPSL